jgi:hypothetical protein
MIQTSTVMLNELRTQILPIMFLYAGHRSSTSPSYWRSLLTPNRIQIDTSPKGIAFLKISQRGFFFDFITCHLPKIRNMTTRIQLLI